MDKVAPGTSLVPRSFPRHTGFTLSVISLKGGVGKTSLVLGLAGAALQHGLSTLVVDLDPQANSTTGLGVRAGNVAIAEVLESPRRPVVQQALAHSPWGGGGGGEGRGGGEPGVLDVLPGTERCEALDDPRPRPSQLGRLRTALTRGLGASGEPGYDLVLLDCPPTLRRLTRTGLDATDRVLVVTEPALFAVQGADRALRAVQEERTNNSRLQPLGVVVNKYDARSGEHQFRMDELRSMFGPLVLTPPVPERSAIQQAQGASMPVGSWGSAGAKEAAQVYEAILAKALRSVRKN